MLLIYWTYRRDDPGSTAIWQSYFRKDSGRIFDSIASWNRYIVAKTPSELGNWSNEGVDEKASAWKPKPKRPP